MSLARLWILAGLLASLAGSAGASSPDLRRLFPRQATLHADTDRLSRLVLPPEVVSACRADLSDLRVFDADGREVPFLVDGGRPDESRLEVRQRFVPELLEVAQDRIVREERPTIFRETYELAAPPEASETGYWDLVLGTQRRAFIRRFTVSEHRTDGAPRMLAEGSVFRIPELDQEKTRVTLPAFSGRLIVTLEAADGSFLEPGLRLESARTLPASGQAVVALEDVARHVSDSRTVLDVSRPRGLVPDTLVVATRTAAFNRVAEVWDLGPGAAEEPLGRALLFRLRTDSTVEALEVPLRPASGDRLRLVIEDADSPALDDLAVSAVVRRPALLLSLPPRADGPAGFLRFGGGRAYRPRYDLAALRPTLPASGAAAEVAGTLYDPERLGRIRLGPLAANPHFDPAPVLAFAHRAGSEVDPALYRHRRALDVAASPEGLARYRLALDDLAAARADLADLRIVDGEERQWAYLLEREGDGEVRALEAAEPVTEEGVSTYALTLPVVPATVDQLVLESRTPYFDRAFSLAGFVGEEKITLGNGRLKRRTGDPRPVVIEFEPRRLTALELEIRHGDDAPLPLERVSARFPSADLYFAAPAGRYWLLAGHPTERPPSYELSRVRDVVLAAAATAVDAGDLEENPRYRARTPLTGERLQRLALWAVLGGAVVVLALLTLRLARQEPPASRGDE